MNEILLVIVIFGVFSAAFWKHIQLAMMKFIKGNAFVKANTVSTIIALYVLIYPEKVPMSMLVVAYVYAFLNFGLNGFHLYKTMQSSKLYLPKGTRSILASILLLMMTPLADTILNRDYSDRAAILFATFSLIGALLNMWQIYLIHPEIRAEFDSEGDSGAVNA